MCVGEVVGEEENERIQRLVFGAGWLDEAKKRTRALGCWWVLAFVVKEEMGIHQAMYRSKQKRKRLGGNTRTASSNIPVFPLQPPRA